MRRTHPGIVLLALAFLAAPAHAGPTGEQLYKQQCASCHGAAGEGTKDHYPRRLEGDRSVAQLAKVIAKTMPEDKPGSLSAEDAASVAAYVHDAFYSKLARERNRPARIELTRLTVRQYRLAVADLIGTFRQPGKWDDQRGLKGEYFAGRNFRNDKRVLERLDPQVDFHFGAESPVAEKIEPHEFMLRWNGSVLAPETGEYEFVVKTEHAARLWVNDLNRPLIDAWVKSGKDTEYRGTLYLVGGRPYPLRLEFTKAKQGVDDSAKTKTKPPPVPASIVLAWKPPRGVEAPIPGRLLSPQRWPEAYVVGTPFPPDDRSYGWERGATVSKAWDQATTDAALAAAAYVAARLPELAGVRDDAPDRAAKLREFCQRFVERAFRRPLTEEQKAVFIAHQFDAAKDPEMAVKRVVLLTLKSPRFLYREAAAGVDPYEVASRLSFGLWDSLPDQELLSAAARGQLASREQVAKQAERMLGDLRARAKIREFLLQWLKVDQVADLAKDPKRFPDFTPAVIADLRTSLELFLEEAVWGSSSDFRQLILSDTVYLNGALAKVYGADLPADAPFQPVKLNPERRAGVLTHPYLMASFAYSGESSPIHRGVFLARGLLGRALKPPPEAVAPLAPDLHPSLTTRERVLLQTKPQACTTCHGMINPLGFTMEHFDAIGRFRDLDHGKPIDASGNYLLATGQTVTFDGARDLARFLAGNGEVHAAFAEQLFHHLIQQSDQAYGPDTREKLRAAFAAQGFNIRRLVVEILTAAALANKSEIRMSKSETNPNQNQIQK